MMAVVVMMMVMMMVMMTIMNYSYTDGCKLVTDEGSGDG
jgi:hypothetical protein